MSWSNWRNWDNEFDSILHKNEKEKQRPKMQIVCVFGQDAKHFIHYCQILTTGIVSHGKLVSKLEASSD